MTTDAFAKLQGLLKELFQIESAADLDFGIYRIMNQKRAEVERFIEEGLARIVDETLKGGAVAWQTAQAEELRRVTDRIKEDLGEYAISSQGELDERYHETRLGARYLALREEAGDAPDQEELKATIFNHLYTFFSRYYDRGDFLSRRRYSKRQKYAIPYNGEEVYLHWANAEQYYVKTGEHFFDYSYKAGGDASVRFKVIAADVEQNNVKGDKRYFIPRLEEATFDEEARSLTVPFEWRPLTGPAEKSYGSSGNQVQKSINERAVKGITARFQDNPAASVALDGESLGCHLGRYTGRNTSDFFIHKNLKGFLEGELDFYLKNEVLNIDDLESWGPEHSESWFEVMRTVKAIGREIIAFLAQIENFQKRLFEKKKFVVSAEYCLTLDRVPEELYPEITQDDEQYEEWKELFHIDEIPDSLENGGDPRSVQWLKTNPYLVLDTKFFDEDFKDRLLASIQDLDEQTDGLLIKSENFQALNLLQEHYREKVKCIYIDPPYNTTATEILYKNDYKHSSWLSLMDNRIEASKPFLAADQGVLCVTIDDTEFHRLWYVAANRFSADDHIGTIAIRNNPQGRATVNGLRIKHEYAMFFARGGSSGTVGRLQRSAELTVLKPRIQKVIYSKDWRDGKPVSREGTSHVFKYMTLESYEDTLNNIAFTNAEEGQGALELYGNDYLLRYVLDFETRDSETLLSVKKMSAPFAYKLYVREEGETQELPVNLPETFGYLLGMNVKARKVYSDDGRRYLLYRGTTREREDVAVIWRDTEGWSEEDYERDRVFVEEQKMAEGAQDVFVNGDSLIPEARPLETVFKRLMLPEPG